LLRDADTVYDPHRDPNLVHEMIDGMNLTSDGAAAAAVAAAAAGVAHSPVHACWLAAAEPEAARLQMACVRAATLVCINSIVQRLSHWRHTSV
jgi:hypothetical protein